jgi:SAP domain
MRFSRKRRQTQTWAEYVQRWRYWRLRGRRGPKPIPPPREVRQAERGATRAASSTATQAVPASAPPPVQTAPDYDAMTYAELQALAKERGLSAQGTREALVERLEGKDDAST